MTQLKRIRLERLMTQEELAKKSDVSLRSLATAEAGGYVGLMTRRKLLDYLGLPRERHIEIFGPIVREDREDDDAA